MDTGSCSGCSAARVGRGGCKDALEEPLSEDFWDLCVLCDLAEVRDGLSPLSEPVSMLDVCEEVGAVKVDLDLPGFSSPMLISTDRFLLDLRCFKPFGIDSQLLFTLVGVSVCVCAIFGAC